MKTKIILFSLLSIAPAMAGSCGTTCKTVKYYANPCATISTCVPSYEAEARVYTGTTCKTVITTVPCAPVCKTGAPMACDSSC